MARIRDVIRIGPRATQPAASAVDVGVLYYVTDEGKTERSDGTNWQSYSDTGGVETIHPFLLMGV